MSRNYRTIDAHSGGEAVRLVVEGFPSARGKTMLEKRDWAERHADAARRALMLEPRGHADMCGAVLTEPVSPGSDAGILFMHGRGYHALSGTSIVAATTIALERALVLPGGAGRTIVYDTAAGVVRAQATLADGGDGRVRVERVTYVGVPAFVLVAGLPIRCGERTLRADIAFGGAFYAIVDSEAAGLGVNPVLAPDIRRVGMEIMTAVEAARAVAHPLEPKLQGIEGTIFTGPPAGEGADLRSATVFAKGAIERSPGGNSTAAVMAVLSAMGLLGDEAPFTHESITGSTFTGRIASRTVVGEHEAIVPSIEGAAWITGEHVFVVDDADPAAAGFLL
jgi:trans-L-3-hydroxyproline dehydratase